MPSIACGVNRRELLLGSLALARVEGAGKPHVKFPTRASARLAVSSYPFRALIEASHGPSASSPGLSLQQFAASIPSKFQVHGIEPWSRHFRSTDPGYLDDLRGAFQKAAVRVVNIPVDEPVHPCAAEPDQRKSSIDTWRTWVDVAVALASPSIRVHMPRIESDPDCLLTTFRTLVDYAAQKNIVINLENDNPVTEEASRIVALIEKIASPFLRALPDFCNSRLAGDEEYNYRAVKEMFAHAYNISHVKDEESVRGKVYRVDLARTFSIARQARYRGYFSMEWEGSGDPYAGTQRLIEASLRNLVS